MTNEKYPHNIEAEKSVLALMMSNREALIEGSSQLEANDFFEERHRILFNTIIKIQNEAKVPVEVQSITNELINQKDFEKIGGTQYLLELNDYNLIPSNYKHYMEMVKDQSVLRAYLKKLEDVVAQYQTKEVDDVSTFIGTTSEEIKHVAERRKISDFERAADVAKRVLVDIRTMKETDEDGVTGVSTGYKKLNKLTHGWQKSDIVIIAARPSVGKTAFGLNLCLNAALKRNNAVGIFSLEMPSNALLLRLIANRSCVELDKIQTGHLSQKDYLAVKQAIDELSNTKLFIDDTPNSKLADILAKARKLKMEQPDLCLLMIDYIGLITTGKTKIESRQVEVSEVSRALKQLARELEVPILVISQLSRSVDSRTSSSRKPMLSDLRESGAIEQDADQVLLLYREDYYTAQGLDTRKRSENDEPAMDKNGNTSGIVNIQVAKNRNGAIGEVDLVFTKSIGRFDDKAYDDEEGF